MVNINKKYIKIAIGGFAVCAIGMGLSVIHTAKNKNNSNVSTSNTIEHYSDLNKNAAEKEKGLTEQGVGSAPKAGKGSMTRRLVVPGTEEYAVHVTSGSRHQLGNKLTRYLDSEFTCFYDEESKETFPVCPDHNDYEYCDGTGDCSENPAWCSCKGALKFCDNNVNPCAGLEPGGLESEFTCFYDEESKETFPVCPDHNDYEYCDGTGDCSENPAWCSCKGALKFCDNNVNPCAGLEPGGLESEFTCFYDEERKETFPVCPEKKDGEYCDGTGDCKNNPAWCSCKGAQLFCDNNVNPCAGIESGGVSSLSLPAFTMKNRK